MNQSKITFEFVRPAVVPVANVNGYWVYSTPAGKLLVEMYYQRPRLTNSISYAVDESGTLGKEIARETSDKVLREVLTSMEMTPELALEFGQYLVETARGMLVVADELETT